MWLNMSTEIPVILCNINECLSLFLSPYVMHSYRLSSQPVLHPEFQHAISRLPKTYTSENKQRFYKLIDNFGTHYMTKVSTVVACGYKSLHVCDFKAVG